MAGDADRDELILLLLLLAVPPSAQISIYRGIFLASVSRFLAPPFISEAVV